MSVEKTEVVILPKEKGDKIREILGEKNDMSENEELKEENEQLKTTLRMVAEQKINEKIAKLNIPESDQPFFRANPEALKGYELGKHGSKDGGSGNVGLTEDQIEKERSGSSGNKEGYSSHEELIKDVCQKASEGDAEMIEVKQKLWEKTAKAWHYNQNSFNQVIEHPNMIRDALEKQNRKWRKERGATD